MKKDLKALIKRLTLLVQFKQTGKGWISIDGSGYTWLSTAKPLFFPSGHSESMDYWNIEEAGRWEPLTDLDNMPLSAVCPSLSSKDALFYTDGKTVWLVEVK